MLYQVHSTQITVPAVRAAFRIPLLLVGVLVALCGEASGQLRVVNYNIAQLLGDEQALMDVFAALHADDKPGFAVPVSVFLFQEVRQVDLPALQQLLNASAPPGVLYAAGTYMNSGEDDFAGAQAMFYRAGMLLENSGQYARLYTGAGRWTARWRLRILGYDSSDAAFFVYSSHLKASQTQGDIDQRLWGVQQIRNNAHALGPAQYIIYAGDHNFYHNQEPGYLWWFHPMQHNQAFDPLGTGSWAGPANAIKHTQSPRKVSSGGLVGGGMDDRFDFQLATARFQDGMGLSRVAVPWAYRAFGNDGLKYNDAINDGNNFYYPSDVPRSNAIADALHNASDHIPVVVDYQLPARMAASVSPTNFGRVIHGGQVQINWSVTNNVNPAHVATPLGADVLQCTVDCSANGAGCGTESGEVEALAPPAAGSFTLNTQTAPLGPFAATITFTSPNEAVQPAQLVRTAIGTVIAPSQPSFSAVKPVSSLVIELDLDPNTGEHVLEVPFYNFSFSASQALLNVDGVNGAAPPLSSVVDSAADIGSEPAVLSFAFDTNLAGIGVHEFELAVHTSDENLPGASSSALELTIIVGVGETAACPADLTGSGVVGVPDLLVLLASWGPCSDPGDCLGDFTGSGAVGVPDLLHLLAAWGPCPR